MPILQILSILGALFLGVVVLLRNPSDKNRWLLLAFNISVGLWIGSYLLADIESAISLFWNRATFINALVMAFVAYLLIASMANKLGRNAVIVGISLAAWVAVILFTPFVVVDILPRLDAEGAVRGYNVIRGTGYPLYILSLLIGGGGVVGYVFYLSRKSRGIFKSQLRLILAGFAGMLIGGVAMGVIVPLIVGSSAPANYAYLSSFIMIFTFAYAIARHKLFDIRLAIARTLSYVLVLAVLVSFYAAIVFGVVRFFFVEQPLNGLTYVYLLVAIFLAFTYGPLKKFFDRITDKIFFHNDYGPHEVLSEIGDITANEIELRKLTTKSLTTLKNALKSEFASVYILPVEQESEPHIFHTGNFPKRLTREDEAKLFGSVGELKDEIIVADQLRRSQQSLQKAMNASNIAVIVKLDTSREHVGHLFFGPKQSGTMYNTKDLQLLKTVGDELALAIQNSLRFKEISEFNEHLQQRIDEATVELQESNKKLQELDEAKDEFISMASHQLRTPLTSVKGYLSMVLDGDAGHITPKQHDLLEEAYTSSQRMVYLIGDFLNVSRLKTGKFVLEMGTINLATVVAGEIEQLSGTAAARNLKLNYEKPAHFPAQVADENKLRQVIMNFIDNAIYYSLPGKEISVELTHKGGEVIFKVRDQGIGVPASERHKLFSKFYRASNARKARPDGTGIGIFMAKKVIVAHGGSILFDSVENKGSTFGFRLPLKQVVTRDSKKPSEEATPASTPQI